MYEAAVAGFISIFQWPAIGYLALGIVLGLYFGAVPGLSGLVGMAILLPFTFTMDAVSAFSFLLGMYAVTTTSDTISSVLLGIPGTAASQATILDGYPMAMKGEAARAFGAAFTVSAIGGVLGAIVLAFSLPVVRPLILSFASPEFFMLGLLGLTMVGSLSGSSVFKGLAAAALGLMISMIGYAPEGGVPRYWFGATYLIDGLPLVPLVLGLFAMPELLDLAIRDSSISRVPREQAKGLLVGVRDVFQHKWLVLRSTLIAVYIGVLPGVGGSIVDWVAYGHAVQSAKDKSQFGRGDVRGVIAPETANNAMKGGALIPTVAFGIPGSAPMAILLGAFLIQGLTPGPQMLTTKLDLTFSLVAILIVANVVGAGLLMLWANQVAKVTFIRGHLIIPVVVLFIFMGAWMSGNNMGDWTLLLTFGVIGVLMKLAGWPRPPLILGFILGPIMENALLISRQSYGYEFMLRPICLLLAVISIGAVLFSIWRAYVRRNNGEQTAVADIGTEEPFVALPFAVLVFGAFVYAVVEARGWPLDVHLFPLAIGIPGIVICAVVAAREITGLLRSHRGGAAVTPGAKKRVASLELGRSGIFILWLIAILPLTWLVGQLVALPFFMALYLLVWGRYRLWLALIYAAAGWVFLYVMFGEIIGVHWYPSVLFE